MEFLLRHLISMKRYLIVVGAIFVTTLLVLFVLIPQMLDKASLAQRFTSEVSAYFSRDIRYTEVEISVLPRPKLTLYGLSVANHPSASTASMLKTVQTDIILGWGAVFDDAALPEKIIINGTQLELESFADGSHNWQGMLQSTASAMPALLIELNGGKINYTNAANNSVKSFPLVRSKLQVAADGILFGVQSEMFNASSALKLTCDRNMLNFPDALQSKCDVEFGGIGLRATMEGVVQQQKGEVSYRGSLNVESDNILPWLAYARGQAPDTFSGRTLPVTFESQLLKTNSQLEWRLNDITLAKSNKGRLKLSVNNSNVKTPTLSVDASFSQLDLRSLRAQPEGFWQENLRMLLAGVISPSGSLKGPISIKIDQLQWTDDPIRNVELSGVFRNNTVRFSTIKAVPDANTNIAGQGILTITEERIKWDSRSRMTGNNFSNLLKQIGYYDAALDPMTAQPYAIIFDIISRGNTINVGNIDANIGKVGITGGVSYRFADELRIASVDTAMVINNLMLAPLVDSWQQGASIYTEPAELGVQNPYRLEWLRQLDKEIQGKITLNNLTYDGKPGDMKMQFAMKPGKMDIANISGQYNATGIAGNFSVEAAAQRRPMIKGNLRLGSIDLGDLGVAALFNDDAVNERNEASIWSEKRVSFVPLMHFLSNVRFTIKSLRHDLIRLDNINFVAEKNGANLLLRNITARVNEQAPFSANASFAEGISTAWVLSWGLNNASLSSLLQPVYKKPFIDGTAFMSARLETSGISIKNWVTNAKSSIRLQARNIRVSGVDAKGLARLTRSSSDMGAFNRGLSVLTSKRATRYRIMEGQIFIKNGQLSLQDITMRGDDAVTKMSGAIRLLPWQIDMRSRMSLITLGSRAPYLQTRIVGNATTPEVRHDATDIENFLARKLR